MDHSSVRFHQVGDLLRWVEAFHGEQAQAYAREAKATQCERQKMALGYLAEHEQNMQQALKHYLEEKHQQVRDTWFDDPTPLPHVALIEAMSGDCSGQEVEDVIAGAIMVHSTLEKLYRQHKEKAPAEAVAELFAALETHQNAELRRIVRDMTRLQDV